MKWDDDLFVEWSQHHYTTTHLRMYRTPDWKLVRDFLNPGKDELYHLAIDRDERTNLIADPSARDIRRRLEAKMLARMRANSDPALEGPVTRSIGVRVLTPAQPVQQSVSRFGPRLTTAPRGQ